MCGKIKKCLVFLSLGVLLLSGCGTGFTWFVIWNTGAVDPRGLVVVVWQPITPPPTQINLVEGEIPKGMAIMSDGTVQGVPDETGVFDFTLQFFSTDGSSDEQTFHVELN